MSANKNHCEDLGVAVGSPFLKTHEDWMAIAWAQSQIGGNPQRALEAAIAARSLGAAPTAVNFRIGMLLFGLGDFDGAQHAFGLAAEQAEPQSYHFDAAGLARAEALAKLGEKEQALAALSPVKENAGLWMGRLLCASQLRGELA